MKWIIVIALVWAAYLFWRQGRIASNRERGNTRPDAPAKPQEMVSCAQCSVHLPRGDALAGPDGRLYCSEEHRLTGTASGRR